MPAALRLTPSIPSTRLEHGGACILIPAFGRKGRGSEIQGNPELHSEYMRPYLKTNQIFQYPHTKPENVKLATQVSTIPLMSITKILKHHREIFPDS